MQFGNFIFCCFLATLIPQDVQSIVDIQGFFPFGTANGDQYLAPGDDTTSPEQPLSVPFSFFNQSHSSLWVNVNGAISFLAPISTYTPSCKPVPRDYSMVSPFWGDVDTQSEVPSPASAISFRESTNPSDIAQAEREIEYAFNVTDVNLNWVYIVTWYNVTFYRDDSARGIRNSFQAALTTNGENSFVIFYYNKIQWTTGQASNGTVDGLGGTPAQVGFDAGDGENRYMLDVSCTTDVINVNQRSNIGVPGEFVFQVDGPNITAPPVITRPTRPTETYSTTTKPLPPTTTPALPHNLDRNCGNTINKVWLDIVAIIDISTSMRPEGLSQVQANLASIVGQMTLNSVPGYSTRIALVTFASNASIAYPYEAFSDSGSFFGNVFNITLSNENTVNILSGLTVANSIFASKKVPNRRNVVILYTSAFDDTNVDSPVPLANVMREDNIKIITVAFSKNADEVSKVGELAWPGYNFTSYQPDLIERISDSLCQANCFCPPSWQQYTKDINDPYAQGYGVCLYFSSTVSAWTPASYACRSELPGSTAYLVTESTQEKTNFNQAYVKKSVQNGGKLSYHNGLQYQNGQYVWQQSNSSIIVPLSPAYTNWNPGYPNLNVGQCVKDDRVLGQTYRWTNENCFSAFLNYICEVSTCDTDNYCPPPPNS
jgi:alpha-tectorin